MNKFFSKMFCAAALVAAVLVPVSAKATPISGAVSIAGSDTFTGSGSTGTSVTFTPTTATILASTLTGVTVPGTVTLSNLTNLAAVNGIVLFTNGVTSFTINGPLTMNMYTAASGSTPASLVIAGNGTFNTSVAGYTATAGSFSLTTSTTGLTSFQIVGAAAPTPEPSSLLLLGTGLVGSAGMLMRRRRNAAEMVA